MQRRHFLVALGFLAAAACAEESLIDSSPLALRQDDGGAGVVYVLSNAAAGNAVLAFPRGGDGSLGEPEVYPTGGTGSGSELGNQGALALTGGWLYAVNAGSDNITGFRVTAAGLVAAGTWSSGGDLPISLARTGGFLYVLNDGSETTVRGFAIGADGALTPIAGASESLGAGVDAAQVGVSPDGTTLVVTLKALNQIVSFPISANGALGDPVTTPSEGMTPFGFGFDKRGTLIVSEAAGGAAGASSASSYRASGGGWVPVTAALATGQSSICWIAVSPNGRWAYGANTGSATMTGFGIGQDGALALLDEDGVTGATGGSPADADFSLNGRYLYVRNGAGTISAFRVQGDGSLTSLGQHGTLPAVATGLAAR